jgi:spermidine/putrescine transport system permease protein
VFWRTLKIAVTATLLCLVIGFPLSYFIAFKVSEKWRAILLGLVVIPSFTSFLIRTIAWRIPLSPNGELSKWLQDMGWIDGPIDILGTRTAVFLAIVYNYIGFMVLPMFVALDRIDPALREASKDLGGTRTSTFMSVTLPLVRPRCHRRRAADVHPDVRRLHHRHRARWGQGLHGRCADRQPVPWRTELAGGLGHGRGR